MSLIELSGIQKSYMIAAGSQVVLSDINLRIEAGEMVAVMGASGSGKSTLMHILGLLDKPSEGEYLFNQQVIAHQSDELLAQMRNQNMGFVFQQFYLLPRMSILDNVALPLSYRGVSKKERLERAEQMLTRVGLSDKIAHRPNQLSGGQQQRVAIARALVGSPLVVFADEPTGALDSKTSAEILKLFQQLNREDNTTLIIVTHDAQVASQCQRTISLHDGRMI